MASAATMVMALGLSLHMQAAQAQTTTFQLSAQPMASALNEFSRQAGLQLVFAPQLAQGKTAPPVAGNLDVQAALDALLRGSGLQGRVVGKTVVIELQPPSGEAKTLSAVTITASAESPAGEPLLPYAGGQVARGGRVGLLGDKNFMDTPFNTVTYTSQTIEDQQARTITDVVENNPTFRFIYPDNDVSMDFTVRGNKVKALDSAYGGLYGLTLPGVEALERIEVITGANALLNGLGPIGGVGGSINQVPKRAQDAPLTRLSTSYLSESQVGVHADIGRRFGTDNEIGVRFNGVYSDGNTAVARQSKTVTMAALGLDYRGEEIRVSADFGYRNNISRAPSRTTYVAAGFDIPAPPKSSDSWQQPWSYDKSESLMGAVRAEVDLNPDITAHLALGASQFREEELFANSSLSNASGALLQREVYWPLYRNTWTAETGLRGRMVAGPVKHNWAVAASGLWVKNGILLNTLTTINTNIYAPVFIAQPSISGLAGPADVPQTGSTNLGGLAIADTLSVLDDRLQLTLGLRHQSVRSENLNAATGAVTSSYDKPANTPGVGVVFKATPGLSVYANYIEGLQQGPVATAGSVNAGEIFAPYVSKQYEAGLKVDFGSFATTFSAYQLSTPNGITDPVSKVYALDGEQRTRGLEVNTFGELARGIRLLGGLALVDAKQTKTTGGTNDGKQVTGAPKVQFNLGTEWDVASLPGLTWSARAVYTSEQYIDLLNNQSIPAWTRYDAGLRYKTTWNGTPTTVRLNVQNVFDKSYWTAAVDGYLVQSAPRTLALTATFDF